MNNRHKIQFPRRSTEEINQDEIFFYLNEPEGKKKIRFHDYDVIYRHKDLYEQLFYDRLKCQSPTKVSEILMHSLNQSQFNLSELRVLDLGAGNGMMGEALKKLGVSRLIGVDIIDEAKQAAERDRPGVYDAYYVADLCELTDVVRDEIESWMPDCLTTVAALGFGDIPPKAFFTAFNLLQNEGWVAFNIKETFLDHSDTSGFSRMIRELIFSEYLDIYHLERYRHRMSMDGKPMYYFGLSGRKHSDVPDDFLDKYNL